MANRQEEGRFMTTAEISDKLVTWGSIKKPMSMSRLGMVLQQAGFQSKRMNHGTGRLPEQADESWQDARMDSKREGIRRSKR